MQKKIVYIQHASEFGGSVMSLFYILEGFKKYYNNTISPTVILAKKNSLIEKFYKKNGYETKYYSTIYTYEHTQALVYNLFNIFSFYKEIVQIINIFRSYYRTIRIINDLKPDIVHLNSIVLIGSALALKKKKIPFVWHIREHSKKGHFGFRRFLIKKIILNSKARLIFICKSDKKSWGNPHNSNVIYNFVDFEKFDFNSKKNEIFQDFKIPINGFRILFLGGVNKIKGSIYLIKAISKLQKIYDLNNVYLIYAGGEYIVPEYFVYRILRKVLPFFGLGTYSQKIDKEISKSKYPENFIRLPFIKNVEDLFLNSDLLIFPSIRPHFPRPIMEAMVMKKPVIGSNLEGVTELITHDFNGLLINPKSYLDIAKAIYFFIENPSKCKEFGENGHEIAKSKFQDFIAINAIYDEYKKF
jgi:glycosyltransferase involved in cell wall biosynthesis